MKGISRVFTLIFVFLIAGLLPGSLTFAIGGAPDVTSKSLRFPIEMFTTDDGLPANTVHSVIQDEPGFLWIATVNGLARYDGYRFVQYPLPANAKADIAEKNIRQVLRGPDGHITVITSTGTYRYNPAVDGFEDAGYSLPINSSFAINQDIALLNNRWIHLDSDTVAILRGENHLGTEMLSKPVFTVAAAHNAAWLSGQRSLIKIDTTFQRTAIELEFPPAETEWGFRVFASRHPGKIWLSRMVEHVQTELYNYDIITGVLTRVMDVLIPEVQAIIEDDYERTWILTHFNGLFLFDAEFRQLRPVEGLEGIAAKTMVLYDDILWISGAGNGLLKIDIKPPRFNIIASDEQFSGLKIGNLTKNIFARGDEVWFIHSISRPTYLNYLNVAAGAGESRVLQHEGNPVVFIDMHTTDGEVFWLGTSGGQMPVRYHWSTGQTYKPPEPDFPVRITGILAEHDSIIWMHTYDQIIRYDTRQNDYTVTSIFPEIPPGTAEEGFGGWISRGSVDTLRNVLWFTLRNYLGRLDISTGELQLEPIPQAGTRNLKHVEVIDSKLWIAMETGLLFLDPDTQNTAFFTDQHGLPDSFVYGFLQDASGNLWISTNRGLSRATVQWSENLPQLDFRNYSVHDGLQSNEFNTYSFYRDAADGRMWFGGIGGINWFYPNEISDQSVTPRVVIDDFRLFNIPVSADSAFAYKKHWHIPYSENDFSLRLSGLMYRRTQDITYAWKLEGQDPDWFYSDQRGYIRYTNLRPGTYTFLAKAANYDGVWSEEERWLITVSTPWWLSVWFIGLMVFFTGGSVIGVSRYMSWLSYRKRLIELEKRELVNNERTRISRDLHDEIGANLTQIAILSELAQRELQQAPKTSQTVERVARVARENISTLSEIVWSLHPGNDTIEQVATYIQNYAESFFENTEIRTIFEIPESFPKAELASDVRHHLLMCVKESLNNVYKHSLATQVSVELSYNDQSVTFCIRDNGIGFDSNEVTSIGNGLHHIRHRLEPFGGKAAISAYPGQGCRIEFQLPIRQD